MKKGFVIAIDGPAASGKGTIVQLLTIYLHGVNIYTGGMYRALALKCIRSQVDFSDTLKVNEVLHNSEINLGNPETLGAVARIFLDGQDVTQAIRTPDVALGAGKVVLASGVREEMVRRQRELIRMVLQTGKPIILDGQDSGTNVYPSAEIKIFLTASQEERARRRGRQYEKEGIVKMNEEMVEEIKSRDTRDFSRPVFSLSSEPEKDGYVLIDSTNLNEEKTLHSIIEQVEKKGLL